MFDASPTRRRLLQATTAALSTTALAGCFGGQGPGEGSSRSDSLELVPAAASAVLHVDVATLLTDDVLRSTIDDRLADRASSRDRGPTSLAGAFDAFERGVGLDVRDLSHAVVFGGFQPGTPVGALVRSDWTVADLRDTANATGSSLRSEQYRDRTVLANPGDGLVGAVGVLGPGRFALGSRETVEEIIDVSAGDATAVGGPVRDGFESAAGGPLRFAFDAPDEERDRSMEILGADTAAVTAISHGYGAYEIDGADRSAWVTIHADSPAAADSVAAELSTARSSALAMVEQGGARLPSGDVSESMLESVTIESDGAEISVAIGRAVALPLFVLGVFSSFAPRTRPRQEPDVPETAWTFDYDAAANRLTITHDGGDPVRADGLFVQGAGLMDDPESEMTGPGIWQGAASGSTEDVPAVVAGDSVSVGAAAHYHCRVEWLDGETGETVELAADRGPDA